MDTMMKKLLLIVLGASMLVGCQSVQTDSLLTAEVCIDHFPYHHNGIKVTKHQSITPVAEFPGLNIVETYYVNEGKALTVLGYEMQRHEIKANDSVIWSLQPSSSNARMDWVLPVKEGFSKENYLGMNNSDYGGGIPVLDLWQRDGGVAIGLIEPVLKMVSMPVEWKRYTNTATMALRYMYPYSFEWNTGDTIHTLRSFEYRHTGDYYNALNMWSSMIQKTFNIKMQPSEYEAFEPVWCAWGYYRTFTIDEIIGTLDKVAELGFRWVDVDDGFQIAEGDWEPNSRFPGGDRDMQRMTNEIHKRGLLAKLWWAPLAADPGTKCEREHPERMLLTDEWGREYITWWDSFYLSPVNPYTQEYSNDLVKRFMAKWGFDGLKIDGQHLNCCQPDFNEKSGLNDPNESFERLPEFFKGVYETAREIKPNAVVQVCPCGCAVNPYLIPYFNQAVASDPTCSRQIRMKRKAYAALAPELAYYGDHVELSDNGTDFASQIGVGSVIGTKFTYPKDNPDQPEPCLLTPEKESLIRKWMKIYKENDLARGEYLNLYTWGFDYPEGHAIRQHDALYYSFYVDDDFEGNIELRGLDKDATYTATEYTADEPRSFTVEGNQPFVPVNFHRNYLLKVVQNN